jgi:DHA2 family methylenomycin A resistance protein-like MFS transporter
MTGLQTSAIEALPPQEAGVASGVFSTSRYLGSIVGSSLLASLLKSASGEDSRFGAVFLLVAIACASCVSPVFNSATETPKYSYVLGLI